MTVKTGSTIAIFGVLTCLLVGIIVEFFRDPMNTVTIIMWGIWIIIIGVCALLILCGIWSLACAITGKESGL